MSDRVPDEARGKFDFCLPKDGEQPSSATLQMQSAADALSGRTPKSFASDLDEEDDPSGIPITG